MAYLTIAIPVKDGEASLGETLAGIDAFVGNAGFPCEVITVDDGSRDRTAEILVQHQTKHSYLKILTHLENRGKGAALCLSSGPRRRPFPARTGRPKRSSLGGGLTHPKVIPVLLLDHLICPEQHRWRNRQAERLRCLHINHELELHRLLHR